MSIAQLAFGRQLDCAGFDTNFRNLKIFLLRRDHKIRFSRHCNTDFMCKFMPVRKTIPEVSHVYSWFMPVSSIRLRLESYFQIYWYRFCKHANPPDLLENSDSTD